MNPTASIIFTIFLFFGLFSLAGSALLIAQFKNERPEYVTAWILGSTLLGLATILVTMKGLIPDILSYNLGNAINAAGCVYFYYAGVFLAGKKIGFKLIALQAFLVCCIFLVVLEVVNQLFSVRFQPAVVALNAFLFNICTAKILYVFSKSRKISFLIALTHTFAIISLIWLVRLISVIFFELGFAMEGGWLNLITFCLLLVFSIARFMFFVGMVTSIEWGEKEDLITQNYLMKIKLAQIKTTQTELQYLDTLNALAKVRDDETGNHILRIQHYVNLLCKRLRLNGHYLDQITDEYIDVIFQAAPLHDIGKIGIPDHILLKKGVLTSDEWIIMKNHALIGETVLISTKSNIAYPSNVILKATNIAGGHHEKWDGSGYPRGLSGQKIPLEARIMALADMYDALVNERPYKKAWTHENTVTEIISKSGNQFDPLIVEAFIAEESAFNAVAIKYREIAN